VGLLDPDHREVEEITDRRLFLVISTIVTTPIEFDCKECLVAFDTRMDALGFLRAVAAGNVSATPLDTVFKVRRGCSHCGEIF